MPEVTAWRKSSYSGGNMEGNCVEVALTPSSVGVRDSKNTEQALSYPTTAWRVFLTHVL